MIARVVFAWAAAHPILQQGVKCFIQYMNAIKTLHDISPHFKRVLVFFASCNFFYWWWWWRCVNSVRSFRSFRSFIRSCVCLSVCTNTFLFAFVQPFQNAVATIYLTRMNFRLQCPIWAIFLSHCFSPHCIYQFYSLHVGSVWAQKCIKCKSHPHEIKPNEKSIRIWIEFTSLPHTHFIYK